MRFFEKASDGGKESGVTGYFLVEIKPLFSIVLLHFNTGSREAFHSHAFNAVTLWLKGRVREHVLDNGITLRYFSHNWKAGQLKYTPRDCFHKIEGIKSAWALSVRGPWNNTWYEFLKGKFITLTHGRKVVGECYPATIV